MQQGMMAQTPRAQQRERQQAPAASPAPDEALVYRKRLTRL
jgi:hypothetical protein